MRKRRKFLPSQSLAWSWSRNRDNRLPIFMEMRLGKTLFTIRKVEETKPKKVLVLIPKTLFSTWVDELEQEGIECITISGPESKWENVFSQKSGIRWFIVNYERVRASPWMLEEGWDWIVLDESTKIRKPRSQISRLMADGELPVTERAKVFFIRKARKHYPNQGILKGKSYFWWKFKGGERIRSKYPPDPEWLVKESVEHYPKVLEVPNKAILSGMPMPESVMDLFMQMKFLFGSFMGCNNYYQFQAKHCIQVGSTWIPKKESRKLIRKEMKRLSFCLSRKEAGMGEQVVRERRVIELPPKLKALYRQVELEWAFEGVETSYKLVLLTWLARLAGGCAEGYFFPYKIDEIVDLLHGELCDESLVIPFRFNTELKHTFQRLRKEKITATWITGQLDKDERGRRVRLLQKQKRRVLLVQAKACQYGLNMAQASTMIWYSRWYDSEINAQMQDRIVHPEKKEPLLHVDLIGQETVDETVVSVVREKHRRAKEFTRRMISLMDQRLLAKGKVRR